jgi:L-malate glycosyltransferase
MGHGCPPFPQRQTTPRDGLIANSGLVPEEFMDARRIMRRRDPSVGIHIEPRPYRSKISIPLIRQIRALVKAEGFTIIHATDGKSLSNAIFATYFLKVKIVSYRGTLARIRRSDVSYWLGILNPRVNKVICVNRSIYDYLTGFFPESKLLLNHKGYDLEWNQELTGEVLNFPEMPPKAFVVMYIAQAKDRRHKGLDILINAMHQVTQEDIHLVFIGSYGESSKVLAENGPSTRRIHLLGQRNHAAAYLQKADVFVLPSTRDGMPRVIKEAMAEAKPVICTDIPGPTDLVVDQVTGLLVEPGSAEAIRDAIITLYRDPALCRTLGVQGQQHLINEFSSASFIDKTVEVYRELTAI